MPLLVYYRLEGIVNIATEQTKKHAAATIKVYPTTSPKRILVTANIGMAKKGCIKLLVESPYA